MQDVGVELTGFRLSGVGLEGWECRKLGGLGDGAPALRSYEFSRCSKQNTRRSLLLGSEHLDLD